MRTHLQVILDPSQEVAGDRPVLYDAVFDEYRLVSSGRIADRAVINRCPWCGTVLPPSKRDLWFSEVERLGLTPDDPELPHRLRTDAWWSR